LLDHHLGRTDQPRAVMERDDGWSGPAQPVDDFFETYDDWPPIERQLIAHARGRVLDLGAGAGRHSAYLQELGHEVVAVDHSPGAVEVCRARGIHAEVRDLLDVPDGEPFDTVLLLNQNLGLAGTLAGTRELLAVLHGRTAPDAVILADTIDPLMFPPSPPHLEYHTRATEHGRDVGQMRLRFRYEDRVTPWLDLLMLRRADLQPVLDGTGWRVEELYAGGSQYGVVLRRT
jgi:SAM-dependent methyltransferase